MKSIHLPNIIRFWYETLAADGCGYLCGNVWAEVFPRKKLLEEPVLTWQPEPDSHTEAPHKSKPGDPHEH